jgi:hypothetical protein
VGMLGESIYLEPFVVLGVGITGVLEASDSSGGGREIPNLNIPSVVDEKLISISSAIILGTESGPNGDSEEV